MTIKRAIDKRKESIEEYRKLKKAYQKAVKTGDPVEEISIRKCIEDCDKRIKKLQSDVRKLEKQGGK